MLQYYSLQEMYYFITTSIIIFFAENINLIYTDTTSYAVTVILHSLLYNYFSESIKIVYTDRILNQIR